MESRSSLDMIFTFFLACASSSPATTAAGVVSAEVASLLLDEDSPSANQQATRSQGER